MPPDCEAGYKRIQGVRVGLLYHSDKHGGGVVDGERARGNNNGARAATQNRRNGWWSWPLPRSSILGCSRPDLPPSDDLVAVGVKTVDILSQATSENYDR